MHGQKKLLKMSLLISIFFTSCGDLKHFDTGVRERGESHLVSTPALFVHKQDSFVSEQDQVSASLECHFADFVSL